jgi:hypothetical protein
MVGLLLFIVVYGSLYLQLHRMPRSSHKTLFLGLLLFIAIRGLGDTDRFELTLPFWAIFLISSLLNMRQPAPVPLAELSTPTKDGQS